MNFKRTLVLALLLGGLSLVAVHDAKAGEIKMTIVNVETSQGVKIWTPESITAKRGDTVTLTLVNKLDAEHGYEIDAVKVKEVVGPQKTATVTFKADKAGIFPIKCQLHPPHVAGQLVVLP
jgi:nitrosocyanin